jgi:hypothetical protein
MHRMAYLKPAFLYPDRIDILIATTNDPTKGGSHLSYGASSA